jgi:lipopolysaccharide heptosyltransferase II
MTRPEHAPLLVRVPNWLGDLVLSLPVLEAAADGPAIFVGPEAFRDLVEARFPNVRYLPVSRSARWAPLDTIRSMSPRLALLLTESFSSALLAWLAGVPERIGFAAEGRGFLLTRRVSRPGAARSTARAAEYRHLAAAAGLEPRSEFPTLKATPEESESGRASLDRAGLAGAGYLVVAPGASYGPAKQWEPRRFARAAAGIARRTGRAVVVVGGPEDRDAAASAAREARRAGAPSIDLAGSTGLGELVGIVAGAGGVISNDSGVMHLAAALRRPTVGVFGSTSPVWTSASAPWVINLYAAYPCSPCYRRTCPIGYGCLRAIEPEAASRALESLLS